MEFLYRTNSALPTRFFYFAEYNARIHTISTHDATAYCLELVAVAVDSRCESKSVFLHLQGFAPVAAELKQVTQRRRSVSRRRSASLLSPLRKI